MQLNLKRKSAYLGLCPIGKFVFSHEDALVQKKKIIEKLNKKNIEFCDLEAIIPDGIVRDQNQVKSVVDYFKNKGIDALFIPHCNFGTEGAAAMIAKKLSVPVLLWGPRDGAPLQDGTRLRDSLCGVLATSKVLNKLRVPFTYIENSNIEDKVFSQNLDLFLKAATVVKTFKNIRIGQIGVRIDFFWSTIINESELLDKFGIQILPVDMADFINDVLERAKKNRRTYIKEIPGINSFLNFNKSNSEEMIIKSLALRDELLELAVKEELDSIAIKSFSSLQRILCDGISIALSMASEILPIMGESDIHGAITSVMLEAATGFKEVSFFPDITIRHPENDNAVLLWHTIAPFILKDLKSEVNVNTPWILKGLSDFTPQYKLKDGPLTLARFDGDNYEYILGIGQGKTVSGPYTRDFYAWLEVENWIQWERKLVNGPYIHHCSAIYDHCADILEEACKYIPGLMVERFDRD